MVFRETTCEELLYTCIECVAAWLTKCYNTNKHLLQVSNAICIMELQFVSRGKIYQ